MFLVETRRKRCDTTYFGGRSKKLLDFAKNPRNPNIDLAKIRETLILAIFLHISRTLWRHIKAVSTHQIEKLHPRN